MPSTRSGLVYAMAPPAPPPALPDTPLEDITKNRQTLLFKGVNGVPTFDGNDPSRWSRFMDSLRTTVAAFPTVQHGVALVDLIDIPGLPAKLRARGLSDPPAELNGLLEKLSPTVWVKMLNMSNSPTPLTSEPYPQGPEVNAIIVDSTTTRLQSVRLDRVASATTRLISLLTEPRSATCSRRPMLSRRAKVERV